MIGAPRRCRPPHRLSVDFGVLRLDELDPHNPLTVNVGVFVGRL
jgi:hypothetical protein